MIEETASATLNIRLPRGLKERGMQVLEREGVSVSDAVRNLFRELEETQELPACLLTGKEKARQQEIRRKRAIIRSWVGALSEDAAGEESRQSYRDHVVWKCRPGVRP